MLITVKYNRTVCHKMQRSLYTYGLAARGKVRSHRMLRVALRQHRTNQTH